MKGNKSKKHLIQDLCAISVGIVLFVLLTRVEIPIPGVKNVSLQPRMAVTAFFTALCGPIVGALTAVLGHILGDCFYYDKIWWSWVIPEIIIGVGIGSFYKHYHVQDGGFEGKNIIFFNIVQVICNAIAWVFVAPILSLLIEKEAITVVFLQGTTAFLGDSVVMGTLGTILLYTYSKVRKETGE
jgi:energy-coupling factor transport system substrate-specific component